MTLNADARELDKFGEFAHRWWDPNSEFRPLHDLNPVRLDWIDRHAGLEGKRILDVGCGGGLLSEGMAARGARVVGIDLSEKPLNIARLHLFESGLKVDYRETAVEHLAKAEPGTFDVITCMEMLEHVPDPGSVVHSCATLLRPGGQLFLSTINRNAKAYMLAVVGAEYILNLLPRGTHDYARFMRPAELATTCRGAGLAIDEITGVSYNPFSRAANLTANTDVNYMIRAHKD